MWDQVNPVDSNICDTTEMFEGYYFSLQINVDWNQFPNRGLSKKVKLEHNNTISKSGKKL